MKFVTLAFALATGALAMSGCHSTPDADPQPASRPAQQQAGSLPAPAANGVSRNLTVADEGKTIAMKTGEKISISLVVVPTAGYIWAADTAPSFVKVSEGPGGPTTKAQQQPGFAGGNHWEVLIVEATGAGEGELVLAQRRPWEPKTEPADKTFKVKLKVS